MYYLYKKSKSATLPMFTYTFGKFEDFYEVARILEVPFVEAYYIRVKSDSYKDIIHFIDTNMMYKHLVVYIEVSESLLNYIQLQKPGVCLLESQSNYEIFKELVSKYNILFAKGCVRLMYFAIEHGYADMCESLELIKANYPDVSPITEKEIASLFIVENLVYPRSVCIMWLRLDRGRKGNLKKCIDYFGNDLVLFAMRKNVKAFLEEKTKYLKTGKGSGLIKTIPTNNIVRLYRALCLERNGFMDITEILSLYEKGVTVNDYLQKRTVSFADAEYSPLG